MGNTNIQDDITGILSTACGNIIDVYYTIYKNFIGGKEEPAKALEIILQSTIEASATLDNSPAEVYIETAGIIQRRYKNLLNEMVRAIMRMDLPVSEFYEKLYKSVFESDVFGQSTEERAVLLYMLKENNPLFPYYPSENLVKMDNEKYKDTQYKIYPYLRKAMHILNRGYETRTEETSQLMKTADEIDEYEDRVVFWSIVIFLINNRFNKKEK